MATRMSVATIDSPEFLNISSINPLISKCEIKVLYIGENRNRSYISKEVATEMAATLPGTPIVGYFIEKKEDFGDHGQQVIIDGEGVKFKTLTTPYGFVAPDAKIWFQKFEDTDDFGNVIVREYLMTEGYLWTGQFEECKRVMECGNPQSMELDENSLKGYWSEDINRGVEFFIINDAIFSKLCILGEDVEPCFEGANVTAPEVSTTFSKDEGFNKTLYTMMKELNNALKGEPQMENENLVTSTEEEVVETEFSENSQDNIVEENIVETEESIESNSSEIVEDAPVSEASVEFAVVEEQPAAETEEVDVTPEDEFACKKKTTSYEDGGDSDDDDEEETSESESADSDEPAGTDTDDEPEEEEEDDEEANATTPAKKGKYAALEEKYTELEAKYSALEADYQALVEFKNSIDEQNKDNLISSFDMLNDEDKKEIIENKAKYSLDEIESKLSVIFARKQRTLVKSEVEEVEAPVIYSVESDLSNSTPDWVNEVLNTQKSL